MEKFDSLKPENRVTVTVFGPDNSILYEFSGSGFHSIETALRDVIDRADLKIDPEDCVFQVANQTTGVSHRYRLNAHGNLKLIV